MIPRKQPDLHQHQRRASRTPQTQGEVPENTGNHKVRERVQPLGHVKPHTPRNKRAGKAGGWVQEIPAWCAYTKHDSVGLLVTQPGCLGPRLYAVFSV